MTRSEALQVAKPILFNTEMVMAIQGGTKTVTRRLVKSNNTDLSKCRFVEMSTDPAEIRIARNGDEYPHDLKGLYATFENFDGGYFPLVKAPYQIGDILYVRESWRKLKFIPPDDKAIPVGFKYCEYYYRANGEICNSDGSKFKWKPSIHMPKEAARIFLRVTGVRAERLQDIDEDGVYNEGLTSMCAMLKDFEISQLEFKNLWNSTIKKKSDFAKYGWDANPFVWIIEFERLEVEI